MIEYDGKVYFTDNELKCKGSGILLLGDGFPDKLLEIRLAYNKSMIINSACRSTKHNKSVGGSDYSYHICDNERGGTYAVDVKCNYGIERLELVKLAIDLGWSVGVNSKFIHLDYRSLLGEKQLLFTY